MAWLFVVYHREKSYQFIFTSCFHSNIFLRIITAGFTLYELRKCITDCRNVCSRARCYQCSSSIGTRLPFRSSNNRILTNPRHIPDWLVLAVLRRRPLVKNNWQELQVLKREFPVVIIISSAKRRVSDSLNQQIRSPLSFSSRNVYTKALGN